MRSEEEIRKEKARVDTDERLHMDFANRAVNPKLYVEQSNLAVRSLTLKWVLGDDEKPEQESEKIALLIPKKKH